MTIASSPIASDLVSRSRLITEADIVFHAGHSGDFYPHHLDAEFSRTLPFGQRIAHGTLSFIVAAALSTEGRDAALLVEGYDRLRFVRPVHIGDSIRVRTTIAVPEFRSDAFPEGRWTERCEVLNQHDQVVLAFEQVLQFAPGGAGTGTISPLG